MLVGSYWMSENRKYRRQAWLQIELRQTRRFNGVEQRANLYKSPEPNAPRILKGFNAIKEWEPQFEPPGPGKWEDMSASKQKTWIRSVKKEYMHQLLAHTQGDIVRIPDAEPAVDAWVDSADWVDHANDPEGDQDSVDEQSETESGSVREDRNEHVSTAVPEADRGLHEQGRVSSSKSIVEPSSKTVGKQRKDSAKKQPAITRILKSKNSKSVTMNGHQITNTKTLIKKKIFTPSDPEWEDLTLRVRRQQRAKLRLKAKKAEFDEKYALAKYEEEKKKET